MEDTTTKSTVTTDEFKSCRDTLLHPPGYGWQPSLLYNQHFGLPPLLDFRDLSWIESIFRKLWTSSWPGYTRIPGFAPQPSLKIHREMGGGVSEVLAQQCRWTASLDVNHFAPSEITVRTQDGFLEIGGKHDERQDEHGYISRCFLRKYKLPVGIEAKSIRSFVTGDGVLTVEALLPNIAPPHDVTIPVQVEMEAPILKDQKQDARQPGEPEIGDAAVRPSSEKPERDTVSAEERIHRTNGPPGAPKSMDGGEEAVPSQPDGERREGEEVKKEEESTERVDSAGAREEVLEPKPEAPEAPQTPDTVTSEIDAATQEKEEEREIQEAEVEGELQRAEAEGEHPISGKTQEEVPSQLEVTEKQAVEQMEQIK